LETSLDGRAAAHVGVVDTGAFAQRPRGQREVEPGVGQGMRAGAADSTAGSRDEGDRSIGHKGDSRRTTARPLSTSFGYVPPLASTSDSGGPPAGANWRANWSPGIQSRSPLAQKEDPCPSAPRPPPAPSLSPPLSLS